jgi:hypothetical protein
MSVVAQDWCYLKIDIENLPVIQQELLLAFNNLFPDQSKIVGDFVQIWRKDIESRLPETKKFLKKINLLDRWTYMAFITGNHGMSIPMHVDDIVTSPNARCYSLNIPVLNCENSYTVFYDAKILDPIYEPSDIRKTALRCDENTAAEIDRLETSQTAWVNVTKPHKPVLNHNFPRAVASLRFHPELHDYFANLNE